MERDISVVDCNFDVNAFCEEYGVNATKTQETDIIAIPALYEKEYYYAQETIDFLKYCREQDSNHKYDVLSDGDIEVRSLHSFDIWMPIIWVGKIILLPFIINMVSNYIWERIKGREKEDVQINISFLVKNEEVEKSITYKGDAKTFKETFEKIDLNEIMKI